MNDNLPIRQKLVSVCQHLALTKKATLEKLKSEHAQIKRPDFLWHYLLQSFATMGRASGWKGLIGDANNYDKVRYEALENLHPSARKVQVEQTCRDAKIRMPGIKAGYILNCFKQVKKLGGPEKAKNVLLGQPGRDGKIAFLKQLSGIGDKYARNIMMDVYHPEFRESIAVDARIKALSEALGLKFSTYQEHEEFYLSIAREAGLNGWELDRLIFNFQSEFLRAAN